MSKCDREVEENGFHFVLAVFSQTGQTHGSIKRLIKEQIRHELIFFEGEAKQCKANYEVVVISMVIIKMQV